MMKKKEKAKKIRAEFTKLIKSVQSIQPNKDGAFSRKKLDKMHRLDLKFSQLVDRLEWIEDEE